jgi:hypothetical protein
VVVFSIVFPDGPIPVFVFSAALGGLGCLYLSTWTFPPLLNIMVCSPPALSEKKVEYFLSRWIGFFYILFQGMVFDL